METTAGNDRINTGDITLIAVYDIVRLEFPFDWSTFSSGEIRAHQETSRATERIPFCYYFPFYRLLPLLTLQFKQHGSEIALLTRKACKIEAINTVSVLL